MRCSVLAILNTNNESPFFLFTPLYIHIYSCTYKYTNAFDLCFGVLTWFWCCCCCNGYCSQCWYSWNYNACMFLSCCFNGILLLITHTYNFMLYILYLFYFYFSSATLLYYIHTCILIFFLTSACLWLFCIVLFTCLL